jgi:hypothetical protein
MKATVFIMFPVHPTTVSAVIFAPKRYEKRTAASM